MSVSFFARTLGLDRFKGNLFGSPNKKDTSTALARSLRSLRQVPGELSVRQCVFDTRLATRLCSRLVPFGLRVNDMGATSQMPKHLLEKTRT